MLTLAQKLEIRDAMTLVDVVFHDRGRTLVSAAFDDVDGSPSPYAYRACLAWVRRTAKDHGCSFSITAFR